MRQKSKLPSSCRVALSILGLLCASCKAVVNEAAAGLESSATLCTVELELQKQQVLFVAAF